MIKRAIVATVCLVLLCAVVSASPRDRSSRARALSEFEAYMREHGKHYPSPLAAGDRFDQFVANLERLDELTARADEFGFAVAVNQFADLSPHEFRLQRLMSPRSPVEHSADRYAEPIDLSALDMPASFDWRNSSSPVLSPVRDQGSTGTCWAFSTAQNIEGQWALAGNAFQELSVEQIVDCDAEFDPNNTNADCGVFGGWPYLSYQYVIKTGGLETEAAYPYCCGTGDCYPCMAQGYNSSCGPPPSYCNATQNRCSGLSFVAAITDWTAISTDEGQIAAQMYTRGPLSVLLNASWLQFYSKGVLDVPASLCDPTALDHAVLLTGWGVDNGTEYWSVKNSWGASWGEEGYFRIARGKGTCGINTAVTSSIV